MGDWLNALRHDGLVDRGAPPEPPRPSSRASNIEYGIVKIFGAIEQASGVPGLDLPGLDIVATARSYGVDAYEATSTTRPVAAAITPYRRPNRPTLINVATTPVGA